MLNKDDDWERDEYDVDIPLVPAIPLSETHIISTITTEEDGPNSIPVISVPSVVVVDDEVDVDECNERVEDDTVGSEEDTTPPIEDSTTFSSDWTRFERQTKRDWKQLKRSVKHEIKVHKQLLKEEKRCYKQEWGCQKRAIKEASRCYGHAMKEEARKWRGMAREESRCARNSLRQLQIDSMASVQETKQEMLDLGKTLRNLCRF